MRGSRVNRQYVTAAYLLQNSFLSQRAYPIKKCFRSRNKVEAIEALRKYAEYTSNKR